MPQALRHSTNPFRDYPEGLEIAPYVYLYLERWPEELPMPKQKPNTLPTQGGTSPNAVKERSPNCEASSCDQENLYYSVTLCVGKFIFQSVLGVHSRAVAFIMNEWLREVRPKKSEGRKFVGFNVKGGTTPPAKSDRPVN